MKENIFGPAIVLIGLCVVVLLCLWPLLGRPWLFAEYRDIDLNSGDLRRRVYLCSLQIADDVEESLLSQEARRLDIDIPVARMWKPVEIKYIRGHADGDYGVTAKAGDTLVKALAKANTPDPERRAILEDFLMTLQVEQPREIYQRLYELLQEVKSSSTDRGLIGTDPSLR
jgi:hypothetical protein